MADPNLDLGLDYTGGITKPTLDQAGYVTRVTSDGLNVEYVPADQILFPVNSLVFATAQVRVDAVAADPGWTVIGGFWLPSAITMSLEAIGAVSDPSLTMTTRLYCVTPGSVGVVSGSEVVITSATDVRQTSATFTLPGSRLYQVQAEVVGNVGTTYFGTVRRTSPGDAAPAAVPGAIVGTLSASFILSGAFVGSISAGSAIFLPGYPEYLGWLNPAYYSAVTRKQFAANVLR